MEQKWIPVSERLPERGVQVLCCNNQGSVFTSCVTAQNRNNYKFGKHYNVIAWMPLPEPYRDGEQPKQTNADRIRNLTDEELAILIINFDNTFGEEYEGEQSFLSWLQKEREE